MCDLQRTEKELEGRLVQYREQSEDIKMLKTQLVIIGKEHSKFIKLSVYFFIFLFFYFFILIFFMI